MSMEGATANTQQLVDPERASALMFGLEDLPNAACVVKTSNLEDHPEIQLTAANTGLVDLFDATNLPVGFDLLNLIHTQDRDRVSAFVHQAVEARETMELRARIATASGRYKTLIISGKKFTPVYGLLTFHDLTGETVSDFVKDTLLGDIHNLPKLLRDSLNLFQETINPTAMTLLLPDAQNTHLVEYRISRLPRGEKRYWATVHQHMSQFKKYPVLERIIQEDSPVILNDVVKDPDWVPHPQGQRSWNSLMGTRLISETGDFEGILIFDHEKPEYFSHSDSRLVQLVTPALAGAIKQARQHHRIQGNLEIQIERAQTDQLTGLHNRYYLQDYFERLVGRDHVRSNELPTGVLYIDLDYFKKLNDRYGHAAGDKALQALARFLEHTFRETDLIIRMGGEEIVVLPVSMPYGILMENAHKLVEEFPNLKVPLGDGREISGMTMSVGVIPMSAGEFRDWEHFIEKADTAMYFAKVNGRNQVFTYAEGLEEKLRNILEAQDLPENRKIKKRFLLRKKRNRNLN